MYPIVQLWNLWETTPLSTQESGNPVLSSRHVPRFVLGLEAVDKVNKSPQAIDGFTLNFEDEN